MMKTIYPLILFVFFNALTSCTNDSISNSFKNYAEMESSGIFEKGWLPRYLPQSATNIKESHDIDLNIVIATFNFNSEDILSIKENCELREATESMSLFACKIDTGSAEIVLFKNGTAKYSSGPR